MDLIAGDLFRDLVRDHEHRNGALPQDAPHLVDAPGRDQHRSGFVPGRQRALDHLGGLGDVESLRGLADGAEGGVGEAAVVVQPRVVDVGHMLEVHRSTLPSRFSSTPRPVDSIEEVL